MIRLQCFLAMLALAAHAVPATAQERFVVTGSDGSRLIATPTDTFDSGWAIATLPDGRMLVTEKDGALVLVSAQGRRLGVIEGTPPARDDGQGGLGDVALHPEFASNGLVYLSPVEWRGRASGAVIWRGRLELGETAGKLHDLERIWEQVPFHSGRGHYSQRLAFGPDGYLYVTSGDRQLLDPAQDRTNTLGTILRLTDAGQPAPGNPFAAEGGVSAQIWTWGHRNPLGLAFAPDGTLWSHEMGPRHGDELNRIERGMNYGWPLVSMGQHYSGQDIPDHAPGDGFAPPQVHWVPAISPAGLVIYRGALFNGWQGDAVTGGLSSRAMVRVSTRGAGEIARWSWDARIREVEEAPDGALWVLEDGPDGRLIRLEPVR